MIKNAIFDMGQVLLCYRPDLFIEKLGVAEEDRGLLLREVFQRTEWVQLDHGTITEEKALEAVSKRLPEHLHKAAEELIFRWWTRTLIPVPGMEELLAELKGMGMKLYLLSNANLQQYRYHDKIPGAQYLDGRIISAEHKMLKPHFEIYRLLLDTYGLKAEECVFVDDSALNVEAAMCLGMQGIVFDGGAARLRRELREIGVQVSEMH